MKTAFSLYSTSSRLENFPSIYFCPRSRPDLQNRMKNSAFNTSLPPWTSRVCWSPHCVLQCLRVSKESRDVSLCCWPSSAWTLAFPSPRESGGQLLWARHSPVPSNVLGAGEGTKTAVCVVGEWICISRTWNELVW